MKPSERAERCERPVRSERFRSRCRRIQGWTLIEMLVVLALSSIVSAAAIPLLREQATRLRRADAMAALQSSQLAQERHRSMRTRYAESMSALGLPATSPSGHYEIAVQHADEATYTLTATARSGSPQLFDAHCWRLGVLRTTMDVLWMRGHAEGELVEDLDRRCWPR